MDLRASIAALSAFEQSANLRGSLYRAVLAAEVEMEGLDPRGNPVTDSYRPYLVFRVELPRVIRVEYEADTSAEVLAAGLDPLGGAFHQIETRALTHQTEAERTIGVLAWDPTVTELRFFTVALLLISVVGVASLVGLRRWADRLGPWFYLRSRYGHRLAFSPTAPRDSYDRPYVEVVGFDDLVALADARYQPIICVEGRQVVEFFVLDEPNAIYRHRLLLKDQ